jgi:hypothetical protein
MVDKSMPPPMLVQLDKRRRVALAPLLTPLTQNGTYLAARDPKTGTITLTPAIVMTEAELELLRDPELVAQMDEADKRPEQRRPRRGRGATGSTALTA